MAPAASLRLLFILASTALSATIPTAATAPPVATASPNLHKRQAWPADIIDLIPSAVDDRFFSIDSNGNTEAVVTDQFSTVTVTPSKRDGTSKTTAALVGIYTAEVNGATEYSFEVIPEVLDAIQKAADDGGEAKREAQEEVHGDLQERSIPAPISVDVAAAAGRIANAIVTQVSAALANTEVVAILKEAGTALSLLIPGGAAVRVITFVGYVAIMFALAHKSIKDSGLAQTVGLPHAMKIHPDQMPTVEMCTGTVPSCSDQGCKGVVSRCSVGDQPGCPCEDSPSQCNQDPDDYEDCSTCTGQDGKCTSGDKKGCACVDIVDDVYNDIIENYSDFLTQQNDAWAAYMKAVDESTAPPPSDPECGTGAPLGDINNIHDKADLVCQNFFDKKIKVSQADPQLPDDAYEYTQISNAAPDGKTLVFSLVWSLQACPGGVATDIDFGAGFDLMLCISNFVDNGAAKCPNGSNHIDNCGIWSVSAS